MAVIEERHKSGERMRLSGRSYAITAVVVSVLLAVSASCSMLGRAKREPFVPAERTLLAESILGQMTLLEKVAQMLVVSLDGTIDPSGYDVDLINKRGVGGVLFDKWMSEHHLVEYLAACQAVALTARNGIPLFVVADCESGAAPFLPRDGDLLQMPTQMACSAAGDTDLAHDAAEEVGRQLRALGINMNLAPVLDVLTNPEGIALGTRTFGSDPEAVARFGLAMTRGFEDGGVIAVCKTFPGLGGTTVEAESRLRESRESAGWFAMTHLLPFKAAVDGGAEAVLVGHVVVPSIDSEAVPASLSPAITEGILRERWRYEGLLVTAPMNSAPLLAKFGSDEAAVRAVEAGADVIVWKAGHYRHIGTINAIVNAVVRGRISEERINRSVLRILRTKERFRLFENPLPGNKLARLKVFSSLSRRAGRQIGRHAVTLLKNEGGILPIATGAHKRVFVTGVAGTEELGGHLKGKLESVEFYHCRTARGNKWNPDTSDIMRAQTGANAADLLIALTYSPGSTPHGQRDLLKALVATGRPLVVVSLGVPTELTDCPAAKAVLATFARNKSRTITGADIAAVADALTGRASLRVEPPAEIQVSIGDGLVLDAEQFIKSPAGRLPITISRKFGPGFGLCFPPARSLGKVRWDFGDGNAAKGPTVRHVYDEPGAFSVSLTVEDGWGNPQAARFVAAVRP